MQGLFKLTWRSAQDESKEAFFERVKSIADKKWIWCD